MRGVRDSQICEWIGFSCSLLVTLFLLFQSFLNSLFYVLSCRGVVRKGMVLSLLYIYFFKMFVDTYYDTNDMDDTM